MKPLVITCGDPAGVGPEIIAEWARLYPNLSRRCVFIGSLQWCNALGARAILPVGSPEFVAVPGKPSIEGARIALAALEAAAAGCRDGRYSAVVTGPVSKDWLAQAGYPFPGQTEFFADRWGGVPSMGFVGKKLKVVLATWHIPLMEVGKALTEDVIERAVHRAAFLANAYGQDPARIGVCGLNPHAGENGLLGAEERDFIDPVLDRLRSAHPLLSRCQPADTVFKRMLDGEFDSIVALYHDQGLGPLKTLEFDSAVNVTLGLPHLRTSPDHGTAFGIAGQGKASIKSFANAVRVALQLVGSPSAAIA